MLKKWVFSFGIASLLAGLLSACGGGTNNEPAAKPQGSGAPASGSASAPAAAPVTLKLHMWYNVQQDNWDAVFKAFNQKYPNIKVEAVTAGDNNSTEYLKKLDLAAASGDQIDVMMFSSATYYAQRVGLNMMEPLDSYIAKDGYKVSDEYLIDPAIGGKTYGLPGKKVTFFVMLNKDHLDEAKLPIPKDWTWDEFMDYAKKLTKGEGANKRYGTFFYIFPTYNIMALANQMDDPNLVKSDGSSNMDNPLIRKSLEIRKQMEQIDKSAFPYAETASQKLNYRPLYFSQKTSMLLTGDYMIPEAGGTDKVPATFKSVFAPYPKVNKSDPTTTTAGSDMLSVFARSAHKQEAYQFIRWYTTEGIQLQGKYLSSWKKADLNKIIDNLIGGTKTPDMVDKESLLATMKNSIPQKLYIPPAYQDEADKAYASEVDKFNLGEQDLETTLKNAKKKVEEVIQKNSKK
ncbi:hypothetical protein SD70_29820 [Gordoniibacillus kamchatkensis]|uniref:ABC transporter substrate-binding protein n=1 Tax=Gordoniibacillus kamchatkensis TaxID=1590651 RepID=A0ABR5AAD8_9BACL|nr:extracellular solute-binding protein [Paenibacillus sp. VKM B-2647]KIL37941.1 hypothetical protein SD70_29820 [Paenibacillus sp. VKM B-2647]